MLRSIFSVGSAVALSKTAVAGVVHPLLQAAHTNAAVRAACLLPFGIHSSILACDPARNFVILSLA